MISVNQLILTQRKAAFHQLCIDMQRIANIQSCITVQKLLFTASESAEITVTA